MNTIYINFDSLKPMDNTEPDECPFGLDFLNFYKEHNKDMNFIVINRINNKKSSCQDWWQKNNNSLDINLIDVLDEAMFKKIDFSNSIYIAFSFDDLNVNAKMKILYLQNKPKEFDNTNAMIVNSWSDVSNILNFYAKYDYETLMDIN